MATQITNYDIGSDAGYRAMGSAMNAFWAAAGLVQTADTGQANWTTAVRSATYPIEIWRFDDELQAIAPVYLKITYGVNNSTSGAFQIQVGQGSNGAGTLTGTISSTFGISTGGGFATSSQTYMSAAPDRFAWGINLTAIAGGGSCYFSVERFKDANGNNSTEGVLFLQTTGASDTTNSAVVPLAGVAQNKTLWPYMSPNWFSRSTVGTNSAVALPLIASGSLFSGTNTIVYNTTDIPSKDTIFVVEVFGETRTYRAMSTDTASTSAGVFPRKAELAYGGSNSTLGFGMRWD